MAELAPADANGQWKSLAAGFEKARAREDSRDRLVEWPAQCSLLGDVTGHSILDLGWGDGSKLTELAAAGASQAVGVIISRNFIDAPPRVELIEGDLNDWATLPGPGLWVETTVEPWMSAEAAGRFAEKCARVYKYLAGILMFQLRPLPARG